MVCVTSSLRYALFPVLLAFAQSIISFVFPAFPSNDNNNYHPNSKNHNDNNHNNHNHNNNHKNNNNEHLSQKTTASACVFCQCA